MWLQRTQRHNQGFTLIEVLITIMLVGVTAAIAAPSFFTWLTNQNVEQALAQVEGALKEAQSTAVKKSRSCTVQVTTQRIKGISIDPNTGNVTDDPACLPTGERVISSGTQNIALLGTGGSGGTTIVFSLKGSTPITQTTEAILVRRTDITSDQKIKCLVISSGVGLIRTGNYTGTTVPSLTDLPLAPVYADPVNPTAAEIEAYNAWLATKAAREAQVTSIVNQCVTPT
jgi:prepilin-type N-terminal cleavage/methylation domain-containing protein